MQYFSEFTFKSQVDLYRDAELRRKSRDKGCDGSAGGSGLHGGLHSESALERDVDQASWKQPAEMKLTWMTKHGEHPQQRSRSKVFVIHALAREKHKEKTCILKT